MDGTVSSVAASHLQGPRFGPELRLMSMWSLARSHNVNMGFLWVLQFLPTFQKYASK